MEFKENVPLAPYTTFKIGGPARFFCIARSEADLVEAATFAKRQKRRLLILGGGSNILMSDAGFSGVVVKNEIMGLEASPMDGGIMVKVGAGESWDGLVEWSVGQGLYGLENLSAIPGTVGAAPVQNISAYGAEISSCIERVRALDTAKMAFVDLGREDCLFEYRDSIFKKKKGRYAISRVDMVLRKDGETDIGYKDIKEYFSSGKGAGKEPTLQAVREAIIDVRWNKLPDWKLWGTAGSFFKNPVISAARYEKLKRKYPQAPGWPEPDGRVKVSAAWLLDNICKAKGAMDGNVGMYKNQALVMVTKPEATAAEVVAFSRKLLEQIEKETTIKLEAEVEWVN